MAKLAVVKTGGKQYLVREGDTLKVEKLESAGQLELTEVLLAAEDDGSKFDLGQPRSAAKVTAEVVLQGRADKILVVHYKAKTRQHKKYGHRQPFTKLRVASIG